MQLSEFLDAYPDFHFDLQEHLRSTTVISSLRECMERFVTSRCKGATVDSYARLIVDSFNGRMCRSVPAYRRLPRIGRLSDLPFIVKDDLRQRARAYISCSFSPEQLWVKNTTGSSGPPLSIFYSPEFYFDFLLLSLQKVAYAAGITDVAKRPVFCVAVSGNLACHEFVAVDPSRTAGLFVQVLVEESNPRSFARAMRVIQELRPICISSKPSIYEMLCSVTAEDGFLKDAPEIVVSGGAEMPPELRCKLERCFASRVVDTYGMTEFGVIAVESTPGVMIIDTSAFCVEVVDDQGKLMPAGQIGELVISSLKNTAMPLLRYRTGDIGALDETGTRLSQFLGRKIQCFKLADGTLFSPTFFNDIFVRFPKLAEFQLIQTQVSHFRVLVDMIGENGTASETMDQIKSYIRASIPGNPTISIDLGTEKSLGKFQRFQTFCR
jgi:phenylacetate-CoA ligase